MTLSDPAKEKFNVKRMFIIGICWNINIFFNVFICIYIFFTTVVLKKKVSIFILLSINLYNDIVMSNKQPI